MPVYSRAPVAQMLYYIVLSAKGLNCRFFSHFNHNPLFFSSSITVCVAMTTNKNTINEISTT